MPQNVLYPTQGILHLILADKEKLVMKLKVNVCLEKSDQDTRFCHFMCKQLCMHLVCFAYINKDICMEGLFKELFLELENNYK